MPIAFSNSNVAVSGREAVARLRAMSAAAGTRSWSSIQVPAVRQSAGRRMGPSGSCACSKARGSVSRSEDEDESILSTAHYGDARLQNQWLNGHLMNLRMRSSPLLNHEASQALVHHFEGKHGQHADEEQKRPAFEDENASNSIHRTDQEFGGMVVFDVSMLGRQGGSSLAAQYGQYLNGFNCAHGFLDDEIFS